MVAVSIGGKRDLIKKANSNMFIAVAIASVVTAFSLIALNFLWDLSQYNTRVKDAKETARDTLIANIDNATGLKESLLALNNADDLIPNQEGKSNTAVVLDALPRKYDFPALRTSVDKLVAISGVKLASFSGTDNESDAIASMIDPIAEPIEFAVNVEGNYKSIKKFITNLENTIRPMEITRVRMSGTDSKMSLGLDIVTQYQPSVNVEVQSKVVE